MKKDQSKNPNFDHYLPTSRRYRKIVAAAIFFALLITTLVLYSEGPGISACFLLIGLTIFSIFLLMKRHPSNEEEKYRTLFDSIDAGYCIIEMRIVPGHALDYKFIEVNPAFERQSSLIDAQGKWMRELRPNHEESWFEIYRDVALTGQPVRFESFGSELNKRWFAVHAFRVGPTERRRVAVLFYDITDRKQAEQALRRSEKELARKLDIAQKLQKISTQLIHGGDLEALYDKILDTALAILKADFATIQMLHPEHGTAGELRLLGYRGFDAQAAEFWQSVRSDSQSTCAIALRTRQRVAVPDVRTCDFMAGSDDWQMYLQTGIHAVQTTPLFSRSGILLGMLSTHWREPHTLTDSALRTIDVLARQAADLIDRKKAEEARKAERVRLETVLRQLPEGVIIADALSGKLILGNAQVEQIWRKNMLPAQKIEDYEYYKGYYSDGRPYRPDEWPLARAIIKGEIVTHEEIRIQRGDGSFGWISANASPIRDEESKVIAGVVTFADITERKLAAEELIKSRSRLKAAMQLAQLGVWEYDPISSLTWFDDRCREIFGICEDRGISNQEMFDRIYPEDRARVEGEVLAAVAQAHDGIYDTQYRITRPEGKIVWVAVRGNANSSIEGIGSSPFKIIGTAMDITERKKSEEALRQLNEALEQKVAERTKLAETRAKQLQTLAVELIEAEERERQRISTLLHEDLQQVLASARMQLQVAGANAPPELMLENVERLLEHSIEKSRSLSHELSPTVLHESDLAFSLNWLSVKMADNFGLYVDLVIRDPEPLLKMPLKTFIFRAVQELLFNCVNYSGEKIARVSLSSSVNTIVVEVSDSGRGFDPNILDTAAAKSGLGLLSLRERASYIGGSLSIESRPGQGSQFTLTVPINFHDRENPPMLIPLSAGGIVSAPSGSFAAKEIRVLVVDQHRVMRQGLIKLMACNADIQIVGEASNGQEALTFVRRNEPNVVVIDVSIPEMGGIEATRRIKTELPHIRVIGLSLYEDEELARKMREIGADGVINKTASAAELLEAICGT